MLNKALHLTFGDICIFSCPVGRCFWYWYFLGSKFWDVTCNFFISSPFTFINFILVGQQKLIRISPYFKRFKQNTSRHKIVCYADWSGTVSMVNWYDMR